MQIRHTRQQDLPRLLEIYAYAREQMKLTGNPTQWGDSRPAKEKVEEDIRLQRSYVLEDEQGCLHGVFAFIIGEDPTYAVIQDGAWLANGTYGTIHRLAAGDRGSHLMEQAVAFCAPQVPSLRIDTHRDNRIMQKLIVRTGFTYCGVIITDDGTPRLAFERLTGN